MAESSRHLFLAVAALVLGLLGAPLAAQSQQPERTARVGILSPTAPDAASRLLQAFRQGLRERGWIEGRNLILDIRYAETRYDRLPSLAAELVALKPDVIFAIAAPAIRAVTQTTSTIPIVIETLGDAASAGLVSDLARPGGNVTGVSGFAPELMTKRLQLLREILPKADSIGVLANLANPTTPPVVRAAETAARHLRIKLQVVDVRDGRELASAFDRLRREGADALLVVSDPMLHGQVPQLIELAERSRLPTVYEQRRFPDGGGLLSYGPGELDRFQRAALYVDRILRGAKPSELPIERPTRFELVINLKAARVLRLAIPQSVLLRADDVIQ